MKKSLIIFTLFLLLFITACGTPDNITIENEGEINAEFCNVKGLEDRVIVFESRYCHNCKDAKPKLEAASKKLNKDFEFLDLADKEDFVRMQMMDIEVKYTPTILANCHVIIGSKSESEYKKEIGEALIN